jgi:hypothetical protein
VSISVSFSFMKKLNKLHPKHRGQVAIEILRLAANCERSDWRKYNANGTKIVDVGEYRLEIERDEVGLKAITLLKRNDGYKL